MPDVYYTVMPPKLEEQVSKEPKSALICYQGVPVYVKPYDKEHYQITEICSTDPAHYLNAKLQPGALISLLR